MEKFLTVAQQVLVLFLLIGVGFFCGKKGILGEKGAKAFTDVVLLFATPCVIIQSFMRQADPGLLPGLGIAAAAALAVHLLSALFCRLIFRDPDQARRRVLRFGVVFSNAGYMALPLQQALLGEEGVLYGAGYVAVFNVVLWSYGLVEMSGDRRALSPKKLLLNPGIIGLAAGLALFFLPWSLPAWIQAPVSHLAALNTPLPMLVIGYYLSQADMLAALRDKRSYLAIGLRLAAVPLLTLGALVLCGVRGPVLVSCVIAASAPSAAATTMFAAKFGQDTTLSVNLVSLSTLLSVITMPLVVGLAQMIA